MNDYDEGYICRSNGDNCTYTGHDSGLLPHSGIVEILPLQQKHFNIITGRRSGYIDHTIKYSLIQHRKQSTFLHLTQKAQPPPASTPTPSVDVNSVTSILLLQMLTNSGLLPSASSPTATKAAPNPVPPAVPAVASVHKPPLSPPFLSLTQLKCFLLYAGTELGVHDASQYKDALDHQGIEPDILAEMSDHILSDIGIPDGDIIHLKKGSIAWWNRPDTKWKRSSISSSSDTLNCGSLEQPVKKMVAYKK